MRLEVEIPSGWLRHESPKGPVTFSRVCSSNALQVSWAENKSNGVVPDVSQDSLMAMASEFGQRINGCGEFVESSGGACKYGLFGTAVFRSAEFPRIQIWLVSDGYHFVTATYVCDHEPDLSEISEAREIALALALGPDEPRKPFWKFWML